VSALVLLAALSPSARAAFAWQRHDILHGEIWRMWTGHLVHFGWSHLIWNVLVFGVAGAWAECIAPHRTRFFYALAPLAISATLLALATGLGAYAGLSGVAAGVLCLLAFVQLVNPARADRWFWFAVLGLVGAKVVWEFVSGQALVADLAAAEARPMPLAHVAGIGCAAAVFFARRAGRR
jgi:rhomboid family GlyGly-CTERM serine protease